MRLVEKLAAREARLAVVGLGYVGLPLAAAFSTKLAARPPRLASGTISSAAAQAARVPGASVR